MRNECKRRLTRAAAPSLPPFPCLLVFFPGNQASFWIYYSPARIIFAPYNPLSCVIVRDNPSSPVWKDFSRLTRRGCVVYTPCVQPWNLCPSGSLSLPFNFIRNTRAIAILSMQIGWNGLASFLSFNPTCILYDEKQTRKTLCLIVFQLFGEQLQGASVATTKSRVNWKFFGIAILSLLFSKIRDFGWDWRAS